MCGNASTLIYSPRRLVAVAASGGGEAAPSGATMTSAAPGHATGESSNRAPESGPAPEKPGGRPDPSAFVRNLKAPMSLGRKVQLVVRNTSIKIKTRQNCCGHPGEPGC